MRDEGSPVKAFASETLCMIEKCVFLCDLMDYGADTGANQELSDHSRCLRLLFDISYLLMVPDDTVVQHVGLLQALLTQLHGECMARYTGARKPKVHYMMHIPGMIRKFNCHMNAFSAERRHKISKSVAASCFKNMAGSLTRTVARQHIMKYDDIQLYEGFRLVKTYTKPKLCEQLLRVAGAHVLQRGPEMSTWALGHIKVRNFVLWKRLGQLHGGFLELCGWSVGPGPDVVAAPFVIVAEYDMVTRERTPCTAVFRGPAVRRVLHPSCLIGQQRWAGGVNGTMQILIPKVFRGVQGA